MLENMKTEKKNTRNNDKGNITNKNIRKNKQNPK